MLRRLSCGTVAVLGIAATWWLAGGTRNPCYYVVMTVIYAMLAWLVGIFILHWGKAGMRYCAGQLMCMMGHAHRNPEVHLPDWEERVIRVQQYGPIKDHWWSLRGYYANVEYCMCKHKGCRAFKIVRTFRNG